MFRYLCFYIVVLQMEVILIPLPKKEYALPGVALNHWSDPFNCFMVITEKTSPSLKELKPNLFNTFLKAWL